MKSSKLCGTKPIYEGQLERVMLNALELRYDFTDKDIVQKFKLEMKRFLEEDAVEGLRVNLKKELAAALEKELQATVEEQERVMASRKELEEKLEQQERYWNLLEQDWKYRVSLLQWLEGLPHGGNGVKTFLGQLNSERIRAWVMGITISSPISFKMAGEVYDDMSRRLAQEIDALQSEWNGLNQKKLSALRMEENLEWLIEALNQIETFDPTTEHTDFREDIFKRIVERGNVSDDGSILYELNIGVTRTANGNDIAIWKVGKR